MREGLKGNTFFGELHPAVSTVYFALVFIIIMTSSSPFILGSAALLGMIYVAIQYGVGETTRLIVLGIAVMLFATVLNGLFTHNGQTVLFYLGDNRITLEAFVYGAMMSLMILGMMFWLKAMSSIMTSDKLIFVFGRVAPVLGLVVSMIFRFIPLLKNRFSEIKAGQLALGRGAEKGLMTKVRIYIKEVSTLISWSLEQSIESADSMAARGYGLKNRSSFHLFKMKSSDYIVLGVLLVLGGTVILGNVLGAGKVYYYPEIRFIASRYGASFDGIIYFIFVILLLLPIVLDIYGEHKWVKSE